MFKKVLWATDGSDAADGALVHAKALATDGGAPLLAVYCEEITLPGKGGGRLPVHANEDELRAKIEGQVAALSGEGLTADVVWTRASAGGAAHAIADVADQEGADVIILGTRGHTPLAGLLLGSVTNRLLHIAKVPVLAVPVSRDGTD
jgi:nucleotide-binding universal stress UspA family protein